jgi:MazG family protein
MSGSGDREVGVDAVIEVTREDREAGDDFARLVAIMRRLRGPNGCPWDREQDFMSLRRYTLEEAYEVVQAIEDGDPAALPGELGDLLLQVVFLAQMGAEEGSFRVHDAVRSISDKLIRRHPRVFGDIDVADADEVLRNWEAIKHAERDAGGEPSLMDDIALSMPALERGQKMGKRAAQLEFDWPDAAPVFDKVREELAELEREVAAGETANVEAELGDVLLSLTSLARHLGVSAEVAASAAATRFERRFRRVEEAVRAGRVQQQPEAMEAEWDRAKTALAAEERGESDTDEVEDQ